MQAIVDFLSGIGDAIVSIVDIVITLLEDIVYVVQICGQMLANLPSYFSWLPAEAVSLIVLAITIIVIYKFAGRE